MAKERLEDISNGNQTSEILLRKKEKNLIMLKEQNKALEETLNSLESDCKLVEDNLVSEEANIEKIGAIENQTDSEFEFLKHNFSDKKSELDQEIRDLLA